MHTPTPETPSYLQDSMLKILTADAFNYAVSSPRSYQVQDEHEPYIRPFESISMKDLPSVGGKNASLGEMVQNLSSVNIPSGYAITSEAYRHFLKCNDLESRIAEALSKIVVVDNEHKKGLEQAGETIRKMILAAEIPYDLETQIEEAYHAMERRYNRKNVDIAVRSSATAEDLPDASFAGQQDTYLNVQGVENVLLACKKIYASLFTNRSISYRIDKGYDHLNVAVSVGLQLMVRSDLATSGVMFTLDTESGFRDAVFITSSYGLGEMVVQGSVVPDEFYVFKPTFLNGHKSILKKRLGTKTAKMVYCNDVTKVVDTPLEDQKHFSINEQEIMELARMALIIEQHYTKRKGAECPMDIEWAKCGATNKLYIVQARPETVQSNKKDNVLETYTLLPNQQLNKIVEGKSIGAKIVAGKARVCSSIKDMAQLKQGEILITHDRSRHGTVHGHCRWHCYPKRWPYLPCSNHFT